MTPVLERFLQYVKIDTQSDPDSGTTPSAAKELDLARLLVRQLQEMGVKDVELTEHGSVYAHLPANTDKDVPTIGFIAHMDTAPDFTGTHVQPRLISGYDGKDITLRPGMVMRTADFPQLTGLKGEDLVVTDGTTLLGADDKAGVAAIMQAVQELLNHPEIRHGRIAIGFTPDEEIGEGTKYFDLEKFGAAFAYTLDGGDISHYADETFNAASAIVDFQGFSIHPGSAKDKMINAASMAVEFHSLLPQWMRPEHTEGYEGFIHLIGMSGNVEHAQLQYILRDHDAGKLEEQKKLILAAASTVGEVYGTDRVKVRIEDSYQNMQAVLKEKPEIVQLAVDALQEIGCTPQKEIVRGGTDGCMLTYKGLPCPNLGTGGGNAHGPYEYLVVSQLEKAVELVKVISRRAAE